MQRNTHAARRETAIPIEQKNKKENKHSQMS